MPFLFSSLSIVAACVLLGWCGYRVVAAIDLLQWWIPAAVVAGVAAADFGSGLVHWGADTWGCDEFPFLGPRLLVPFRVHHINPDEFHRRRFVDTNGDVAFIAVLVLTPLFAIPLESRWGAPLAIFGFAFCAVGSATNQIHQWAHMPRAPHVVRLLQACGVLLGRRDHALHHAGAYDRHYCITTGWCNRPLEAIDFFRRLESLVTAVTGAMPRADDRKYEMRFVTRGEKERVA